MTQGLSPAKIVFIGLLGLGIGVGIRQWRALPIDLELGGTKTGSVGELVDFDESRLTESDSSDSSPPFDIGGFRVSATRTSDEPIVDEAVEELAETNAPPHRPIGRSLDDDSAPAADEFPRLRLVSEAQPAESNEVETEDLPRPSRSKKELIDEPANDTPTETESNDPPPVKIARKPDDSRSDLDLSDIDRLIKGSKLVEAHQALSKIFWQQPEYRSQIQERIDATAKAIYFSPQPHVQEPYVIQAGDQLRKIAREHHVPWQYLARLNKLDPKRIREGQKLKVIDGPFGAVVTLRDFELVIHHRGQFVRRYQVCIGKDDSSPVGKFKVLNKVVSPQYTDPDGKVFAGTDPRNPLGKYWLDLGDSYGIHGTIDPDSIGKAESRGCIRLLNEDVEEVHDLLDLGAEVIIRR